MLFGTERRMHRVALWLVLILIPAGLRADAPIDPALARTASLKTQPPAGAGRAVDTGLLSAGFIRTQITFNRELGDGRPARAWIQERLPRARWEGHWRRWADVVCPVDELATLAQIPDASELTLP
ncbi:MAG: hypothetical protein GF355_17330, partial [Candidatus Eisenbacteria bacterium]|nr:hypothetical protein [Candidatus Eisenbacteria bacterium]